MIKGFGANYYGLTFCGYRSQKKADAFIVAHVRTLRVQNALEHKKVMITIYERIPMKRFLG